MKDNAAEDRPSLERITKVLENAYRISGEITASGHVLDVVFNVRLAISESVKYLREMVEEEKSNASTGDTEHKNEGAGTA